MTMFKNPSVVPFELHQQVTRDRVKRYVKRCTRREERLVIMLRYAENLSFEEIAAVLDMSLTHVLEIHEDVVLRVSTFLVPTGEQAVAQSA